MTRNRKTIIVVILGVGLFLLLWIPKFKQASTEANEESEIGSGQIVEPRTKSLDNVPPVDPDGTIARETKEQREIRLKYELLKSLDNPVNFWGKVIDEKGNPISGAEARISVTDRFSLNPTADNTRTEYLEVSDSNGLFSLLGKKGGSLYVNVHADGFAPSYDKKTNRDLSRAGLSYYGKYDSMHFSIPTENNPMTFVLRKKNAIANISHSIKKRIPLGITGELRKIELDAGEKSIEVEVRCWSSCPVPFTYDKYDWRAEIRIAGGNLRPITEFDPVTAPTDGYQQVFKVEMPKDTEENWIRSSPNGTRDFWIQFDDGTYAKARIEVKTGRTHELDAEVWYNLDGTNNFEQ